MPVTPICLVKDGSGSFVGTDNGINATPGNVISIKLNDTAGVVDWFLQCIGTDELSIAPTLTNVNPVTNQVTTPGTIVTFTMPNSAGRALLFRSTVTGSGGPADATFSIYTVTGDGSRVGAVGEQREGSLTYGWITKVNPLIRAGAGGGLPPLLGQQYAVLMENPIGARSWGRLTQDMILPAFAITGFSGPGIVEVGATVTNPSFAASYSLAPDNTANSVVLTDDQGNPPLDVTSTPTSFSSTHSFTKNTYGATVVFTDTAKRTGFTRSQTWTTTWLQKVYWGTGPAGQSSAGFITGLANSALASSQGRTFNVTAGPTEKVYYAYRTAYGAASFAVNGFSGGFNLVSTSISVTNSHGFTENFTLYESANLNLGAITVTVT